MKKIFDETHGYIDLNEVETDIVDAEIFQRLRRIRQTSLAYLVYPGATHTRFSHSLGTLFVADKIGRKMLNEGMIDYGELEHLRIAALLHDLGQFPFSHAIEGFYLSRYGEEGSNESIREMALKESQDLVEVFQRHSLNTTQIIGILDGYSPLSPIIDSDVDADRIDYLIRDSKHTGVSLGNVDTDRLLDTVSYEGGEVVIKDKGIQSLENFYVARLHMYQAVYYHKTILGYELLLRKIYEKILPHCCPGLETLKGVREMISSGTFHIWDDEWMFSRLYGSLYDEEVPEQVKNLINGFLNRRGPKVVFEEVAYRESKGDIRTLVSDLERAGVPQDSIYPFEERIRVMRKDSILVSTKSRKKKLSEFSQTILSEMPESMLIRRIYVDHQFVSRAREVLK
ncbi:phosphohydrolase [Sulfodiicoccus acidiphilus]|uniref:Phosphohydrolase n=1 Tax=Sulfodiicoccus acidiphilus TaxID=1670455 RepID=A0A348B6W2_9CREN|nr:HD domain-containing protein [Sulfodiicoccus acidiphilus]BBD73914.1 phosphohydrolase [Sulfodiicoccus acidiphilus]GGU03437.1 phosphohydrolase [Sulfodiicoccus acidiphilus]